MSTALQLYGKGYSKADKRFKFILSNDGDDLTLHYAAKGWNESELTFIRDKIYKGVFESYSTNELTFVKEGRDFIQTAYETSGIDHEVTIAIYILKNDTFSYQLYFSGKLDLSTYKIDSIGVTCEVIPTGFQNLILNRDDIDVDMMSTKYIGGADGSMEYLNTVWDLVTIPEYQATQNSSWNISGTLSNLPIGYSEFYLPMDLTFSEYEIDETFNQVMELVGSTEKFLTLNNNHTVDFKLNITINLTSQSTPGTFSILLYLYQAGLIVQTFTPDTTVVSGITTTYTFVINQPFTFNTSEVISLSAYTNGTELYYAYVHHSNLELSEEIGTTLAEVSVPMFYIYEAFVRTLQLTSGDSQPFHSHLLGRTDSAPDTYITDGTASLMAITCGKWIREFNANATQLLFNLKDLFTSINAIWNIGLGFETISGDLKVVVEDESYFFDITENSSYPTESQFYQVNQILDLSSYLNNEMISKEVLPDWYANEIEGGYGTFEYENVQGLKEFNTKSSWAVPIKSVKTKLNLVSAYRADTQGVNKLRAKPVLTFPAEDVSGDNDIFMFDVKRAGTYVFTVKTWDDFDYISGGVDPQSSYNLNFTPRRNLERHGNRLDSMRLQATDEIQWLKSDKNNSLVTQRNDETTPKAENGDILISDLTKGYWIPEAYNFEAPVNLATVTALQANPRGVIKIGTDKYGWILDVQTNNEKKKGTFKLLRVNLTNVKIIVTPPVAEGIGTAEIELDLIVT